MESNQHRPIAILGAGSWGTALALHLAKQGQIVRLWSCETAHIHKIAAERVNQQYLPGCSFPQTLYPMAELEEILSGVSDILIAVPSVGFRTTLRQIKPFITQSQRILWVTKGLDVETQQLLHEVALTELGAAHAYAVLSGPSFAKEVALGLPTAVVIASQHESFARDLLQRFNQGLFRVYLSADIPGVEICGVIKNVLAIATGISDGMGWGANARCALIARGLTEITRLGLALGGKLETFIGLAGLGDLVLTCTDDQSRNRRFGLALGQGKSITQAENDIGQVIEGKQNAAIVRVLSHQHRLDMPIVEAVWSILQGIITPIEAMQQLFAREPKAESC